MCISQNLRIFIISLIMDQSLLKNGKRIFIYVSLIILISACKFHKDDSLFIPSTLQDSLEVFIAKNKASIINPYDAPTIGIVIIDEIGTDTIVSFMANINLIEDVIIDEVDKPKLEIQGACIQDGMVIVLYGSKQFTNLVNYKILNLQRKSYDYFHSYQGSNNGFEFFPISYRRYRLEEDNKMELQFIRKSRYEID